MRALIQPAAAGPAPAPVRVFLVFAALALAAFAAQRVVAGGLSAADVEAHYLGAGEGEALALVAVWEEVHAGAFVYGFVLFMLASLLAVGPVPPRLRAALVGGAFAVTMADLLAPFAIVLAGAGGALRVGTFVLAVASVAALLAVVAATFGRGGGEAGRRAFASQAERLLRHPARE
jgi:hypothetical protein